MLSGKSTLLAMGMAIIINVGLAHAGEAGYSYDNMMSMRRNAKVAIGGEIRVDYSYRTTDSSLENPGYRLKAGDLTIRNANLRINADVHPNLKAIFKINLNPDSEPGFDDDILAEAMLVMGSVGGAGLELFAGKGRAPYGQDVTLGMLQSYHHSANRADSPEGRIFIVEPPADDTVNGRADGRALSPMRPGQFDQAFVAGAAYEWDTRWRVEIAAFQPGLDEYRPRLREGENRRHSGSDIGFAGRVWWNPIEDLVLQASAVLAHSSDMGRAEKRSDLRAGAKARSNAYAVSVGFDWRPGAWRVFGEYQRGRDWNFSDGYDTETWQIGVGYDVTGSWRVGGMVEGLEIKDPLGKGTTDNYYKLALNVRYMFDTGLFVLAEYGHEWFRREIAGAPAAKRRGDYFGVRVGLSF